MKTKRDPKDLKEPRPPERMAKWIERWGNWPARIRLFVTIIPPLMFCAAAILGHLYALAGFFGVTAVFSMGVDFGFGASKSIEYWKTHELKIVDKGDHQEPDK